MRRGHSAVRYTDCVSLRSHPSSKLLGYWQSSAARTRSELLENWQRAIAQEPLQAIAPLE
jgi:hypothetical protein